MHFAAHEMSSRSWVLPHRASSPGSSRSSGGSEQHAALSEAAVGIPAEQWPRTPEGIAEWLEWFDSIEPIEMTSEERAEWQAALEAQKAYGIAELEQRARRFEDL